MELAKKKLSLIERLMRVGNQETLEQVEELLVRVEMESRAKESLRAIEENDVVSFEDFGKKNQSWLQKKSTK